jgi:hypothetical protein
VIRADSNHLQDPFRHLDRFTEVVHDSIIYHNCLRPSNVCSVLDYNAAICTFLGNKLAANSIILTVHAELSHSQTRSKSIEPVETASGEEMLAEKCFNAPVEAMNVIWLLEWIGQDRLILSSIDTVADLPRDLILYYRFFSIMQTSMRQKLSRPCW